MQLTINLTQKNTILLCATFIGITLFTVWGAAWQWHHDWELTHQPISTSQKITPMTAEKNLATTIADHHLFGKSVVSVPITNLQLRVTGILKEENDSSKASISTSGQPDKLYQVGDELPDGVKVYAITNHAVILENEGHLEKLPLPREQLQFKPRDTEDS